MNRIDQIIIDFLARNPFSSSKEIHEGTQLNIGYATVKRILKKLIGRIIIALGVFYHDYHVYRFN